MTPWKDNGNVERHDEPTRVEFRASPDWLEERQSTSAWDGIMLVLCICLSTIFTCFIGVVIGTWVIGRI